MRWLLLAAAVLVAGLLVLLLQDDEPPRREPDRPDPLTKEEHWREKSALRRGGAGAGDPGKSPGPKDARERMAWEARRINEAARDKSGHVTLIQLTVEVMFADGTPAADAEVSVYPYSGGINPRRKDAVRGFTDKNGIVKLRAGPGTIWVFARRGALVGGPARGQRFSHNTHFKLLLGEAFMIRGIVLRPDGRPANKPKVTVNFWDGWEYRFVEGHASEDGRFELLPVPRRWIERMHVYVKAEGLPRCLFRFPAPATDLRLQLTTEAVRGRVIDEQGHPLANVSVSTGETWVRTDKDGRFEAHFQRREGQIIRFNNSAVVLKANDEEIELVVRPGTPLRGRLLWHDGKGVAGAFLTLSLGAGPDVAGAGSDNEGWFRFLSLAQGPHTIRVRLQAPGAPLAPDFFVRNVRAQKEVLDIRLPKPVDARIRLRREDGREAVAAKHVTLVLYREGIEMFKKTWPQSEAKEDVRFLVWEAGQYNALITTAFHEPARLGPIRIGETGRNVFDLPLKKRAHVR